MTFTTNNSALTVTSGTQNNCLNLLGFSSGDNVSASYNTLSQIGITTGDYTENGQLTLDTSTLTTALANDPDGVINLLTNNGENSTNTSEEGIFTQLYNSLSSNIEKLTSEAGVTGSSDANTTIGKQVTLDNNNITTLTTKLTQEQNLLWTKFDNMETMLTQLNNESSELSSMMSSSS